MKNSFYNLYAPCPQGVLCFNACSDNYVIINKTVYQALQKQAYDKILPSQLASLTESGFIVDDEVDEYEKITAQYKISDRNGYYRIVLLPTLDCNVKCWYCFEKQIKGSRLSADMQERMVRYAYRTIEREDISHLHINLFGGEPMLHFKEEVYPILYKVKEYADTLGKKTSFSAVSNAICITDEIVPLLADLGMTFQISIDGYKEKHNSIKKIPGLQGGTYELVMQNIHKLTEVYNPHINLRINYDNQTLKHIGEVIKDIGDIDRHKIRIHLERVWQTSNKKEENHVPIKDVINEFLRQGFYLSYLNFHPRNQSCVSDLANEAVLSYDGKVYKCTGRDFEERMQEGTLMEDGTIDWMTERVNKRLDIRTFDNPTCRTCKLLPQCWGPCTQKQLEYPEKIAEMCQLRMMEMDLNDYICYRFNNEYIGRSLQMERHPIEIF